MSDGELQKKDSGEEYEEDYVTLLIGLVFLIGGIVAGITVTPWITFGLAIPAAALLGPWVATAIKSRRSLSDSGRSERELLSAITENGGDITPAEAAMQTSLTIKQADEMLTELANGGHLKVESSDGVISYSLPQRPKRELD